MPNGDSEWFKKELPELEAFFEPMRESIEAFASAHNLLLEKYYHEGRDWSLTFRHPLGGIGKIQLLKWHESIRVHSMWWLDDYVEGTRWTKHVPPQQIERGSIAVTGALNDAFHVILNWTKSDLSAHTRGDLARSWHSISKAVFESQNEKQPTPKI